MCTAAGRDSKVNKLSTKISLWQGDITKLKIDVIVNSIHGNEEPEFYDFEMEMDRSITVAGCIFKAGGRSLYVEAATSISKGFIPVITKGYDLPAKCKCK